MVFRIIILHTEQLNQCWHGKIGLIAATGKLLGKIKGCRELIIDLCPGEVGEAIVPDEHMQTCSLFIPGRHIWQSD